MKSCINSKAVNLLLIIPFLFLSLFSHAQLLQPNLILSSGGTDDDDNSKITYDNDGNLYCVADYEGTPLFNDIVVPTFGSDNIILSKYDNQGNLIWGKTIAHASLVVVNSLSWNNGKLLMSGYFRNNLVFILTQNGIPDTLEYSGFFYDPFIAEFYEDGTLLNKMSFDCKIVNDITGIKYFGSNIMIYGYFEDTLRFNKENSYRSTICKHSIFIYLSQLFY